jgi:tRNA pseudouridine38-40 synthase
VTRSRIPLQGMKKGLNSLLPEDIFVKSLEYVPLNFHSRYNARTKTYEYRILNRVDPDVFLRRYVWHIRRPLDAMEMERCLSLLVGRHDFSSFKSSGSGNRDPIRTVFRAELQGQGEGLLSLSIEADGFLRHMVRNIVGTAAEVGLGKMSLQGFKEILEAKNRRLAGVKAPAQGLFLKAVHY